MRGYGERLVALRNGGKFSFARFHNPPKKASCSRRSNCVSANQERMNTPVPCYDELADHGSHTEPVPGLPAASRFTGRGVLPISIFPIR